MDERSRKASSGFTWLYDCGDLIKRVSAFTCTCQGQPSSKAHCCRQMASSLATERRLRHTQTYPRACAQKHTHVGLMCSQGWTRERGRSWPSFSPQTAGSSAQEINYLDTHEFSLFTSAELFTVQTTGLLYKLTSWSLCGSRVWDYNQIFWFYPPPPTHTTSGFKKSRLSTIQISKPLCWAALSLPTIPAK